jgi:hypothetical protein
MASLGVSETLIGLPVRQPNANRDAQVVRNAIGVPIRQANASRNAPVVRNAIGLKPLGNIAQPLGGWTWSTKSSNDMRACH